MSRIANISLETIAPITTNLAAVSHDDDAPRSPSAQLQVELDQQVFRCSIVQREDRSRHWNHKWHHHGQQL